MIRRAKNNYSEFEYTSIILAIDAIEPRLSTGRKSRKSHSSRLKVIHFYFKVFLWQILSQQQVCRLKCSKLLA